MSHSHLTLEERISIEVFVSMGLSCREMARRLGRSHSTLSRELRRNSNSAKRGYRAQSAERRARKRRKRARHYRCMNRPGLIAWVDEKLRANWSPEQIAGRIRLEYPEDQSMRISTETIYRWVYQPVEETCFSRPVCKVGDRAPACQLRHLEMTIMAQSGVSAAFGSSKTNMSRLSPSIRTKSSLAPASAQPLGVPKPNKARSRIPKLNPAT